MNRRTPFGYDWVCYKPDTDRCYELGSGNFPQPGFIHVDKRPLATTDVCIDLEKVKLQDYLYNHASIPIDRIYTANFIEHISHTKIDTLLHDCYMSLKVGGTIEIHFPDFIYNCEHYLSHPEQRFDLQHIIFGNHNHPDDTHKLGYTPEMMVQVLEKIGFTAWVLPNKHNTGTASVGGAKC